MKTYKTFKGWIRNTIGKRCDASTLVFHERLEEVTLLLERSWNAALASVQTKEDVSCEKTEQSPYRDFREWEKATHGDYKATGITRSAFAEGFAQGRNVDKVRIQQLEAKLKLAARVIKMTRSSLNDWCEADATLLEMEIDARLASNEEKEV